MKKLFGIISLFGIFLLCAGVDDCDANSHSSDTIQ